MSLGRADRSPDSFSLVQLAEQIGPIPTLEPRANGRVAHPEARRGGLHADFPFEELVKNRKSTIVWDSCVGVLGAMVGATVSGAVRRIC